MKAAVLRTQLCCGRRKLLECSDPIGLKLPLADHVSGLEPSQCCVGRVEGLKAKHRARDPLYETVVLFHDVVEVFDLEDLDGAPRGR